MKNFIKAREMILRDLFAPGTALSMPFYQRSYSWNKQHATVLLEDLIEAATNETPHFIGAIVIVPSEKPDIFDIVDGQQRLTTVAILLAILRDHEKDKKRAADIQAMLGDDLRPSLSERARWRLSLDQNDMPFFSSTILENGATRVPYEGEMESPSQKCIYENRNALQDLVSSMNEKERRSVVRIITEGCVMVRVTVNERMAAYRVYRVLNTRGHHLNSHEMLKADLLDRSGFTIKDAIRFSREWARYENLIGADGFNKLLGQIRFIHDKPGKGDILAAFRKVFSNKAQIRDFFGNLLPRYVKAYDLITTCNFDKDANSQQIRDHIARLLILDHGTWVAPALQYMIDNKMNASKSVEYFKKLERFGYAAMMIISTPEKRKKRYRTVCEAGKSDRALYARRGALTLSNDERRKMRERLLLSFGNTKQRRTIARRLNAALEGGESLMPSADATVEHVLPSNPDEGSHWLTVWPSSQVRAELCNTIGNFILLPQAINQQAGAQIYQLKKELYFDGADGGQFALTRDLEDIKSWTPPVVRDRTKRLAHILAVYWELVDKK